MSFIEYFKEKAIFIMINILVLIITGYLLNGLGLSSYGIILICILNFLSVRLFSMLPCFLYLKEQESNGCQNGNCFGLLLDNKVFLLLPMLSFSFYFMRFITCRES